MAHHLKQVGSSLFKNSRSNHKLLTDFRANSTILRRSFSTRSLGLYQPSEGTATTTTRMENAGPKRTSFLIHVPAPQAVDTMSQKSWTGATNILNKSNAKKDSQQMAKIVAIHRSLGEFVEEGDLVATLRTVASTSTTTSASQQQQPHIIEVHSPETGFLRRVLVHPEQVVSVGSPLFEMSYSTSSTPPKQPTIVSADSTLTDNRTTMVDQSLGQRGTVKNVGLFSSSSGDKSGEEFASRAQIQNWMMRLMVLAVVAYGANQAFGWLTKRKQQQQQKQSMKTRK